MDALQTRIREIILPIKLIIEGTARISRMIVITIVIKMILLTELTRVAAMPIIIIFWPSRVTRVVLANSRINRHRIALLLRLGIRVLIMIPMIRAKVTVIIIGPALVSVKRGMQFIKETFLFNNINCSVNIPAQMTV